MSAKFIVFIVLIGLLSVFLWTITLYNGWLNEAYLFGTNIISSWFSDDAQKISTDENKTTVKSGEYAYKLLSEIEIPDNIAIIEKNAFRGNKLTSVTIGSNVSLGVNAVGSGFETVYIGNGKQAGTYTRTDRKSTEWLTWYDGFRYRVDNGVITITGFNGTDGEAVIPGEIYGNPVKIIEARAFYGKNLTGVIIPDTVTIIEEAAFFGNWDSTNGVPSGNISSVTFGRNVAVIGNRAFENNKLSSITIPGSVTSIGYSAFGDNPVTRISLGTNVTLGSNGESIGILGTGTGFNSAYANYGRRAGTYTRPNINSTNWTRR